MLKNLVLLKYCKYFVLQKSSNEDTCYVCGYKSKFVFQKVIDDNLAKTWGISQKQRDDFDNRESLNCQNCNASLRIRNLARAILKVEDTKINSIKDLVKTNNFKSKNIAEINNCGALHDYIKQLKNLSYSEFNPTYRNKVQHQDLLELSYKDKSFDLILTSDTLEHIPSTQKALQEIHRVLKPGGYHIFTVPMLPSRKTTIKRAKIVGNSIDYIKPKSYHGQETDDYLVFYEFGRDLLKIICRQGFSVMLYYCNMFYDEHSFVFVTRKEL